MRIETKHGRHLLCGHIIGPGFILPGQKWAPADGSDREVTVSIVYDDGPDVWVAYTWQESGEHKYHHKTAFAFQCRYCLVIDKETTAPPLDNRKPQA